MLPIDIINLILEYTDCSFYFKDNTCIQIGEYPSRIKNRISAFYGAIIMQKYNNYYKFIINQYLRINPILGLAIFSNIESRDYPKSVLIYNSLYNILNFNTEGDVKRYVFDDERGHYVVAPR